MRGLLTALLILTTMSVFAEGEMHVSKGMQNVLKLSTGYFYDSDAITDELALEYFYNGFITDAMKDRVSPKLSGENRLGAASDQEISYTRLTDSLFGMKNCYYRVSIRNRNHVNSRFSDDVFELYLRGNKDYAGKTAQVSDFAYQNIAYQQLNFTFGHHFKRGENHFSFTTGFSLNNGQNHYMIETRRGYIYTDVYGEYIDFDIDGELHRSDSTANKFGKSKGIGAAFEGSFGWEMKNKNKLTLTAENFGFITWNSKSTFVSADTIFHFEGVEVSYLFDLNDTIRKTISLDSSLVEPYLTERTQKSYTSPLPALVKLNYEHILKPDKMKLEAEAGYLAFATAMPYGSVKYIYNVHEHEFGLKLRYGGYGLFNAGLSYQLFFLNHWMFTIESDYLSSMLNPKKSCGHGAFASLTAFF